MLPAQFLAEFPLVDNVERTIKVIIGERPYRQYVGITKLAVGATTSQVALYQNLGHIAFLVSDWVKVQDSLEMVFNLLFGHGRSLCALAMLRRYKISPASFTDHLWDNASVALLNAYGYNDNMTNQHRALIQGFIEDQLRRDIPIHALLFGKKAQKAFGKNGVK